MISESHLNIRDKCPEDFMIIGRSKPIESACPRGGVVAYKHMDSLLDFEIITDELRDCLVFRLLPVDIVVVAVYIPPSTSKYSSPEYMENLQLILSNFKNKPTYIVGDLNARYGDMTRESDRGRLYKLNPDTTTNTHGRALSRILKEETSFAILNGLNTGVTQCESDFTFFRGELCSQIDIAITNSSSNISSFQILEKNTYSDHKPISVGITAKRKLPLHFVDACASNLFMYKHFDVNRKIKRPVKLEKINIAAVVSEMEQAAEDIERTITENPTIDANTLCKTLTKEIYRCCAENRKKNDEVATSILNNSNCTSANYKAIAKTNFLQYQRLLTSGCIEEEYKTYRDTWIEAEQLTVRYEEEEYNTRVNERWKYCAKNDPKKMWKEIDWKGKSINRKKEMLSEYTIHSYFKQIFQSPKTANKPTLDSISIPEETNYIEELDKDITIEEVNKSIKTIGKGVSLDGISPDILHILPMSMRVIVCKLYNMTFSSHSYPTSWEAQLLLPHPKKGHTLSEPKLRGVGIGPALSRGYDSIIDTRFCSWYVPNKEQAAYTSGQGCPLQVFSVYLLMELAKAKGKQLFIGYMDYEKAFDFLNRKLLIEKLQSRGAGSRFTSAVFRMYTNTSYRPKISESMLGEAIPTKHGVTQGKKSSANLYSFFVSDMGTCLIRYTEDFMDPANLCQLADDTATAAESTNSMGNKLGSLFEYSDENDQIANIGKTLYLHLSKNPVTEPIKVAENQFVESAHKTGYPYLGNIFICSDILKDHILKNINHRKGNMSKFYAWLQYNQDTPIMMKLIVLYNCVLAAIFYCSETWYEIDEVSQEMLSMERTALKRCLGVKASTPDDIVYTEVNRATIVNKIKEQQHQFFTKLATLDGAAIVCDILDMCSELDVVKYYNELTDRHCEDEIQERKDRMNQAESTHIRRYVDLTSQEYCHPLYESYLREDLRTVITRWRLSCIPLEIEIGRYKGTRREDRLCPFCDILEDEEHALFHCDAYEEIRRNNRELLEENQTLKELLNPKDKETAYSLGCYLKEIEERRKSLVGRQAAWS